MMLEAEMPPPINVTPNVIYHIDNAWLLWVALIAALASFVAWVSETFPSIPIQESELWESFDDDERSSDE